jgi:hypothetical protein
MTLRRVFHQPGKLCISSRGFVRLLGESDKLLKHLRRLSGSILIMAYRFFEHFRKQPRLAQTLFASRLDFVIQEGVARTGPDGSEVLSIKR